MSELKKYDKIRTVSFFISLILSFLVLLAYYNDMVVWKHEVNEHVDSKSIHMIYQEKVKEFVPRKEYENSMNEINKKLDNMTEILEYLRRKNDR